MSMTRKDYVAISDSLRVSLTSMREGMVMDEHKYGEFGVEHAARMLAMTLSWDNERFDAERFLEAVGVTACTECGTRASYHSKRGGCPKTSATTH